MEVVMFALSITVYEIFAVDICMTLTLTFGMGYGHTQIIYANRKPKKDFLFNGNSNVNSINYRLRDIRSRNLHDLVLDF